MGRGHGGPDRVVEVVGQSREVHFVAESLREGVGDALAVVAGPVEPAIDGPLDPTSDRLEERECDEGRDGDGERLALGLALRHADQNGL